MKLILFVFCASIPIPMILLGFHELGVYPFWFVMLISTIAGFGLGKLAGWIEERTEK